MPQLSSSDIKYRRPATLTVTFNPISHGHFQGRLELIFKDENLHQQFMIAKVYKAIVGKREDYEHLRPREPYKPRIRGSRAEVKEVVPGVESPALKTVPWVISLPQSKIPGPLERTLGTGSVGQVISTVRDAFLPAVLNSDSYGRHFKNLVWCEEYRAE